MANSDTKFKSEYAYTYIQKLYLNKKKLLILFKVSNGPKTPRCC